MEPLGIFPVKKGLCGQMPALAGEEKDRDSSEPKKHLLHSHIWCTLLEVLYGEVVGPGTASVQSLLPKVVQLFRTCLLSISDAFYFLVFESVSLLVLLSLRTKYFNIFI